MLIFLLSRIGKSSTSTIVFKKMFCLCHPAYLADYLRLTEAMALYGADLRMPHSRALGAGLFELRPKGPEGIGRVFYCTQVGRVIVILHSFIKKTQETPDADMRMARKRLKEVKNG